MSYKYWYLNKGEPLEFGLTKTAVYDMGTRLYTKEFIIRKLTLEALNLGRVFLCYAVAPAVSLR